MDQITVKLQSPVEHDGRTYNELVFREPTVADMIQAEKFEKDTLESNAVLLAALADVSLPVIKRLKLYDYNACDMQTVPLFLPPDKRPGEGEDPNAEAVTEQP
ncbi:MULTISPECIES: phage tail assembly protein [unclassified Pseudovibrio]|uniref:phage tail assembly protein n=1 Tax=unclassified Pseudovibrio TaxID=2627060 RepID=UPI0007AE38D1|nr:MULTISPECIES: phage tail assembly protein [unclassified Pseudovibrio]KZK95068.1 hypothetical protein PsW74_04330 [Pseudovibrio sp. W74]KZL01495.1 hypothetical protein PsAD26_04769 [Pseudovibrio sp. Ad26]KZL08870.1 hypothetical protein PsAD14_02815 [Pseudovibrio sp. Ad14]